MSRLSKSQFLRGMQCHKSLWLYRNSPELRTEPDASQQAILDTGTEVGIIAQELFPGGHQIVYGSDKIDENVKKTKELIDSGVETIYEASFIYHDILVMVDILHMGPNGWEVYEVKSSTSINEKGRLKNQYRHDVSVQYYVLDGCGLELSRVFLVYLNNEYIRNGELDLGQLFRIDDVSDEAIDHQAAVKANLATLQNIIDGDEPQIDIGPHCSDPYQCDFTKHCWRHVPEYSVFNIYRLRTEKKFDLYQKGIIRFEDLPADFPLGEKQRIQVNTELTGQDVVDKEAIEQFLSQLEEPIGFLDFETFQQAVPALDRQRPYQQIPFQFSLHILENNKLEHYEYLGNPNEDPRIKLLERMITETRNCRTILVYSKGFENTRMKEMAKDFPDKEIELMKIIDRVVDLIAPFRAKQYYTKAMKGRESIKAVLPALIPGLSYSDTAISDGGMAMRSWAKLPQLTDAGEKEKIRSDLLKYCELDTYAMVKILEKLKSVV